MYAGKLCFALALCCALTAKPLQASVPAAVSRCHYGDTACVVNSANELVREYAKKGYPGLGLPVLEPFFVKRVDIADGNESSLNLKLNFRDVNLEGFSGVKFERTVGFERDPAKSKFELYGSFPKIALNGKYTADGRILILPIKGDGDAQIILQSPKFSVKFKPSTYEKDGQTFISVDKLKLLVEPQKMTLKLTNLFNGDKALGDNLNLFLNENWNDVWTELQPAIHSAIAEIVKSIIDQIFKKFPYTDLFLED